MGRGSVRIGERREGIVRTPFLWRGVPGRAALAQDSRPPEAWAAARK